MRTPIIPSFFRHLLVAAGLSFIVSTGLYATPKAHPNTAGWPALFNGDLSNATTKPGDWNFANGVLVARNHETLWTKKSYHNFVLDLEFKVAKEANSGVFLRSGDINDVLAALEIQVHENQDGALYGMVGAIYNAQPPSKNMAKPVGEWNHFTITCRESHVSLIFNGEEVFNVDLNDWKEPHLNPDGTPNKFSRALKDFSRTGPIGLQGLHGKAQAPVWYRNLRIKELK
ncbi:MAG TPA: DUF1080 domain-containing protein [Lacunisphaera sp.]|jgi:hypothetical protein